MSYVPTRLDVAGNLPISRSISTGAPSTVRPGELAVNAADGVMYVGLNTGLPSTIPAAVGFSKIVTLTETEYGDITPDATTLYIVTPDPE